MNIVTIHHLCPGKEERTFEEGFAGESQHGFSTLTHLPVEISRSLSERLQDGGFIETNEVIHFVEKHYSFIEPFNLLVFRDENKEALGYYSDIAMPIRRVDDGFELLDLFLDIWLKPDGTLLELDMDEFQDAISKGLITEEQQKMAATAFERLKNEARQGIYPQKYIQRYTA